jgi:hypothetical protein
VRLRIVLGAGGVGIMALNAAGEQQYAGAGGTPGRPGLAGSMHDAGAATPRDGHIQHALASPFKPVHR